MGDRETDQIQNTEITLSTGKLLGIFFGLALICGLFFTMGYMLGHSSAAGGKTEIIGSTPASGSSTGKPSAANKAGGSQNPVSSGTPVLSQTPTPAANTTVATPTPATAAPSGPGGTFMVQVAAVSRQEDAEILVTALHKKQYPVFIANVPGDALFHVQVGPFTDQKDADAMKNRLAADGYSPIVKK